MASQYHKYEKISVLSHINACRETNYYQARNVKVLTVRTTSRKALASGSYSVVSGISCVEIHVQVKAISGFREGKFSPYFFLRALISKGPWSQSLKYISERQSES